MKTMRPVDRRSSGRNNAENDNGPSDENECDAQNDAPQKSAHISEKPSFF